MNGRLLITCPDRHGIVAAVAGFLADSGANIISSDQHSTDPEGGEFFMRMEFNLAQGDLGALGRAFQQEVADRLDMRYRLTDAGTPKRMAMLVSKEEHCLVDLLWRHRRGELDAEIDARRLQPPGPQGRRRGLRHPVPPRAVPERAGAAGAAARAATWSCWRATCASSPATSSSGSRPR